MDSIVFEVAIQPTGLQIRLNRHVIAGPRFCRTTGEPHRWPVSKARVEKALRRTEDAHFSFVLRRGRYGIDALLNGKVIAGSKKNKHWVELMSCEVPRQIIVAALEASPTVNLEIGRFYATGAGEKVMIFKKTENCIFHGVIVDWHEPHIWNANGLSLGENASTLDDIVCDWAEAEGIQGSS